MDTFLRLVTVLHGLSHIIESKRSANREKDRLFLATYEEALRQLLGE